MKRQTVLLFLIAVFGCVNAVWPEVLDSGHGGFHLKVVVEVDVSPNKAYGQFLRVGEWWNADHTWFGDAKNLYIEPVAGGCFCETSGDRSVLHMLVSFVEPGKSIRMLGGLGPLQEMGLQGVLTFQFDPLDDGGTRITHEYRVSGYTKDGLKALAPIVDQVQSDQVSRLKNRLNKLAE